MRGGVIGSLGSITTEDGKRGPPGVRTHDRPAFVVLEMPLAGIPTNTVAALPGSIATGPARNGPHGPTGTHARFTSKGALTVDASCPDDAARR